MLIVIGSAPFNKATPLPSGIRELKQYNSVLILACLYAILFIKWFEAVVIWHLTSHYNKPSTYNLCQEKPRSPLISVDYYTAAPPPPRCWRRASWGRNVPTLKRPQGRQRRPARNANMHTASPSEADRSIWGTNAGVLWDPREGALCLEGLWRASRQRWPLPDYETGKGEGDIPVRGSSLSKGTKEWRACEHRKGKLFHLLESQENQSSDSVNVQYMLFTPRDPSTSLAPGVPNPGPHGQCLVNE